MIKNKSEKTCKCGALFIQYKTTDKYCSLTCSINYSLDRAFDFNKIKNSRKRNTIAALSNKRQKQYNLYLKLRAQFLPGKICPVTHEPASEIHHKKGRVGELLTDVRYFLGVTRDGHKWIEEHPAEAKQLGYSLNRL